MPGSLINIGVAGLGRAFTLMLPTFLADARVGLVAATDSRPEAGERFAREFSARLHPDVASLCADPDVDLVYIATPHQLHAEHVLVAAACGKHVLVEKPMAISIAECQAMIDATRAAGVHLIVGHSHSFDPAYLRARAIIESGALGAVRMVTAQYFTDFLYRPRRPEELDTARGGGVVFSQAAHQIDIVRLLAGGMATTVRAQCGTWDRERPTEGAYGALIGFAGGAFASVVYSGYGHFDGDEMCDWIGESGVPKDPGAYRSGRTRLEGVEDAAAEARLKAARNFGGAQYVEGPGGGQRHHQHFGHVLVCCDRGDIKPGPRSVTIYGDSARTVEDLPEAGVPRREVIDEVCAAVFNGVAPLHDGAWSLATLEVCLAMLESARTGREMVLEHQIASRDLVAR